MRYKAREGAKTGIRGVVREGCSVGNILPKVVLNSQRISLQQINRSEDQPTRDQSSYSLGVVGCDGCTAKATERIFADSATFGSERGEIRFPNAKFRFF